MAAVKAGSGAEGNYASEGGIVEAAGEVHASPAVFEGSGNDVDATVLKK
jgi:hypothetical protein